MVERTRPDLIGDTAIALLAERGLRGLTHRAVDEAAGLPPGSTSNRARTRSALLETAFARLCQLEAEQFARYLAEEGAGESAREGGGGPTAEDPAGDGAAAVAALLARQLHDTLTRRREQTLARFELALEATRRPELRAIYDAAGATFRAPAAHVLAAAGVPDPEAGSRSFIAWCEGVLFDSLAGAGAREVPSAAELERGLVELLRGMGSAS